MASDYEFFIQASIRGYHAYFANATVYIGEVMDCDMEPENDHDKYAVAVRNTEEKMVGHIPVELSKIFHKFLSKHGRIEAECISCRFNAGQGKGLELAIDFRLVGNAHYLRKVVKSLRTKQEREGTDWKISDLREYDTQV